MVVLYFAQTKRIFNLSEAKKNKRVTLRKWDVRNMGKIKLGAVKYTFSILKSEEPVKSVPTRQTWQISGQRHPLQSIVMF